MTTVIPFLPSTQAPYQFRPILDGATYAASTPWSLFGRRYYFQLSALNGSLIVYEALIGSPSPINIEGFLWTNGFVNLICTTPHGVPLGQTVNMTVQGCAPAAYNGVFQMYATDMLTLTYNSVADPGPATQLGGVSADINLVAGYGFTSTLVYRPSYQRFEINP